MDSDPKMCDLATSLGPAVKTSHSVPGLWVRSLVRYCNKFNEDFKNGPHQKEIFFKNEICQSHSSLGVSFVYSKLLLKEPLVYQD